MYVIYQCEKTGLFDLYEDSGQCIEPDFKTVESAEEFAIDNNYTPVEIY